MPNRAVFFISDRTGITAEALGNSLLSQFEGVDFECVRLPFVDTKVKAEAAAERISQASEEQGRPVLVFSTQITAEYRDLIRHSNCIFFDFFDTFISRLEQTLGAKSSHTAGRLHAPSDDNRYNNRIDNINFTLNSDDGLGLKYYDKADVILLGVSRSGKTPSCLFMAMQYGIKAANYPLLDEDLENTKLPETLKPYRDKLFALTINPTRLHNIRDIRKSNSNYASLQQCQSEVRRAEDLYRSNHIPFLDTTQMSIEEISAKIINKLNLNAHQR